MIELRPGHYEITAKLGEGGMGVALRSADTDANRPLKPTTSWPESLPK